MPLELLLLAQMHAPNRLSAGAYPQTHWGAYIAPPDSLAGLARGGAHGEREVGRGVKREEEEGRDGRGGEGVPECPNPELASLGRSPTACLTSCRRDAATTYPK